MSEYQVLARKYRPQTFGDVFGQSAIVTTLKNAIKRGKLAHGYLFCGSRGTGKTTLARIFAKALNCLAKTADFEPCNKCSSCIEITSGHSLDVMEIDGASNRGIDDIRQINENVGYTSSCGQYKIYIIDEVHMLTKEAFNALLKTLEEPPAHVKFFFATTEPHKVLPTILSRCQRFNLSRIPLAQIVEKLRMIATDLNVSISDEAISLIAMRADGGLRDAESLLDQIIAFNDGTIDTNTIADILGIVSKDLLFKLDEAGKAGNVAFAFELADRIFSEGKDILHFVETLNEHIRNILLIKLSGIQAPFLNLSESEKEAYELSAKLYTQEQCTTILDFLIEAQNQIRYMSHPKIALEALLIRIIRTHQRVPIDFLVRRLTELEKSIASTTPPIPPIPSIHIPESISQPIPKPLPQAIPEPIPEPIPALKKIIVEAASMTVDPTPTPADLGIKIKETKNKQVEAAAVAVSPPIQSSKYDTIFQFAAVELEGIIQKKR